MSFNVELVGKIGSMALINKEDNDINYNIFARLSKELKPGHIWVSSGATEIGRLDYIKRSGQELEGDCDEIKTDYAAQGQAILMQNYRNFIDPKYSVRQVLVEHQHFNDTDKREHLKAVLQRCTVQNAIPIINYNDAVSFSENRKMEIQQLQKRNNKTVECVDNDETASQIACLLHAKYLVILSNVDGIYKDPKDPSSVVRSISGKTFGEVLEGIELYKKSCIGASRKGANGAFAKLEYIKDAVAAGTTVFISSAKNTLKDIVSGKAVSTKIGIE